MRISAAIMAGFLACLGNAAAQDMATPWQDSYNSRARLIVGNTGQPGAPRFIAGVEIRLGDGWKTYWRNPGESGGIPPRFDWSKSANLASARVLYPAPERFKDALGDAIGYKRTVVFPIEITAKDASRPLEFEVLVEYGICRDICVPSEVTLRTAIPADAPLGLPPELAKAVARVPRAASARRPADPVLAHGSATLAGPSPSLVFEVTGNADLFLEAPGGIFLPVPKKADGAPDGSARFVVELGPDPPAKHLKGKSVLLTIVGPSGATETEWTIP